MRVVELELELREKVSCESKGIAYSRVEGMWRGKGIAMWMWMWMWMGILMFVLSLEKM